MFKLSRLLGLTGMADNDMVWVDDGMGPVKAAWSSGPYDKTHWIREPRQIKQSEVTVTMKVLSEKELAHYRKCIEQAEKHKKSLKK